MAEHDDDPHGARTLYRFGGSFRLRAGERAAFDRLLAREPALGQLMRRRFRTVRVPLTVVELDGPAWQRAHEGLIRAAELAGAGRVRVACEAFDSLIHATGRR